LSSSSFCKSGEALAAASASTMAFLPMAKEKRLQHFRL
jgi:hypothetical protein